MTTFYYRDTRQSSAVLVGPFGSAEEAREAAKRDGLLLSFVRFLRKDGGKLKTIPWGPDYPTDTD